jgi:D-alanyl-D-alanine dipeptidase
MRAALPFLALALAACASAPAPDPAIRPAGFLDAASRVPGLAVDMRYTGAENFTGRPVPGYDAPVCLLAAPAADALARVQARLAPSGLGLKVYDCYRPARAVASFAAWARDPADQTRKADYYPNVDKSKLFDLGYIAERSGHSRGATLDVTLIDLATRAEIDMGSGYDLFDALSWPDDPRPTPAQRANRLLLQTAMTAEGFRPLREEWWHFTLNAEPWPGTYFDFPVAGAAGVTQASLDKPAPPAPNTGMIRKFNPPDMAAPMSPYSHGVSLPAGARIVQTAGQVGVAADGVVPPTLEGQLEQIWLNTAAILRADGMELSDVVSIRGYLVSRDGVDAYRAAFRKYMGDVNPTSTLVVVKELVAPQFLAEIEVVAAKP